MRPRSLLAAALLCSASAGASFVTPETSATTGGTVVYITTDRSIICMTANCTPIVLFDGIASPDVKMLEYNQVSAVVPPHREEAIVNIEVNAPYSRETIRKQFAYVDRRDTLLVPFTLHSEPGYGGSRWSTELWVHNATDHDVSLMPKVCGGLFGLHDCNIAPFIVAANSSREIPTGITMPGSMGTYYFIPHAEPGELSFDLRLFDETHPDTSSTSIPVVRPQLRTKVVLLNVPNDGHGRMLLRAYGSSYLIAHVYDLESGERLADEVLSFSLPTDLEGPMLPAMAGQSSAIFDIPAVRKARRLRVEIESPYGAYLWAIITITDNVTQHVTVITPAS